MPIKKKNTVLNEPETSRSKAASRPNTRGSMGSEASIRGVTPAGPPQRSDVKGKPFLNPKPPVSNVDLLDGDYRAAVYCVLMQVGFNNFSGLTPEESARLKVVEGFVAFERGLRFYAIRDNLLKEEGITPVPQDAQFLQYAIDACNKMTDETRRFQQNEFNRALALEQEVMLRYFQSLENKKAQENAPAMASNEGSSKAKSMKARMAWKQKMKSMIENSLDVDATMRKTAGGSGARAAMGLRETGTSSATDEESAEDKELNQQGLEQGTVVMETGKTDDEYLATATGQ